MDKKQYWFDNIFEAAKRISGISRALKELANSFYATGNEITGDNLHELSHILDEAEKNIRITIAQHCRADCKETEQATANMVLAALAMGKLRDQNAQPL